MVRARALPSADVVAQADEVMRHQQVGAVKTGALGSVQNVQAVAKWLGAHPELVVVVDPVMAPTRAAKRSARLTADDALAALRNALIPRATLVTANADEAERLVGLPVRNEKDAATAAKALVLLGARAALVKGGHLDTAQVHDAVDVLAIGTRILKFRAARLPGPARHGGGCMLASLIAGRLAVSGKTSDAALVAAVRWAKQMHHALLARPTDVSADPESALVLAF
jgi:hydroxymethylpyrimidine/phosphomethylpyrimidine kinase